MESMTFEYGILRFVASQPLTFSSNFKGFQHFQLISYAGYQNSDGTFLGDPMNVEITDVRELRLEMIQTFIVPLIMVQVCLKLGWKTTRTEFDLLPLILSANGHE